jgi:hypothetical protein
MKEESLLIQGKAFFILDSINNPTYQIGVGDRFLETRGQLGNG